MKKQLLYTVALCSSFSLYAVVNEDFALENLAHACAESQQQAVYDQILLMIRQMQDVACSTQATVEQVKEELSKQLEPLKNIPNENTAEAYMLRQSLEIVKLAVATVAEVTRKNQLPAVDSTILKKGVDVQATRLKIIEYIESLLK